MINQILRYTITFIVLVLIQLLVCNNIQFSGYVNPFIYVLFILILPVEIPTWLLLILAFCTGFSIDLFIGTAGLHAFATVVAAYSRPAILRLNAPRDGYDSLRELSMVSYGFTWFLLYASMVVFIHHFVLFYLEVFRLTDFFSTLLRIIASTFFSIMFILLAEFVRRSK